ncbi:hypothetical protein WICPIJ_006002 [Wickerhamomyces pijperi]|uniref:Uncharacterized protein n=1 Tax=Wickerhamomyces pijperi TaxID=599730 RepID=A0A9P8Q2Y1_WICPI|nr:hypothetical protein WICPIJ_006002 [Wickerhamomyces pijperi]
MDSTRADLQSAANFETSSAAFSSSSSESGMCFIMKNRRDLSSDVTALESIVTGNVLVKWLDISSTKRIQSCLVNRVLGMMVCNMDGMFASKAAARPSLLSPRKSKVKSRIKDSLSLFLRRSFVREITNFKTSRYFLTLARDGAFLLSRNFSTSSRRQLQRFLMISDVCFSSGILLLKSDSNKERAASLALIPESSRPSDLF